MAGGRLLFREDFERIPGFFQFGDGKARRLRVGRRIPELEPPIFIQVADPFKTGFVQVDFGFLKRPTA